MKSQSIASFVISLLTLTITQPAVIYQNSHSQLLAQNVRNSFSNWRWSNLGRLVGSEEFFSKLVSFYFPPGFRNGQVALRSYSPGGIEYVVAQEGIQLPGITSASIANSLPNSSFFGPSIYGTPEADRYPAIPQFPQSLYNQGKLIVVRFNAPRYNDAETTAQARSGRKVRLSDGRYAYYLRNQYPVRNSLSLCAWLERGYEFESSFICVSSKRSSQEQFYILDSIIARRSTARVSNQQLTPSSSQQISNPVPMWGEWNN